MPYKLLALDMDGTLLTSTKRISSGTRVALQRLANRGVAIAYCSGRCFNELLDYPRELPFVRYGVLASGAVVYDFTESHTLVEEPIAADVVLKAMEVAQAEDHMTHVMTAAASVVREEEIRSMPKYGMGVYQGMFEKICVRPGNMEAWVEAHPGEVVKVNFYHANACARDGTRERLERSELPLTLANAEQTSIECSARGVSKAKGLGTLAAYLGCTLEEVVAIGDSDNDAAALSAVGMPVAMGNATDSIKRLARLVVADNDHDGIAEAIEKLFP